MALEKTSSFFKLKGKIEKLNEYSVFKKKNDNGEYAALSFNVVTLDNESGKNSIRVEFSGNKGKEVYTWNKEEKTIEKFPWAKRYDLPTDNSILGTVKVGAKFNEKEKLEQSTLHSYDAVDFVFDHFNDGDSVYVNGNIDFHSYVDSEDNKVNRIRYNITSIGLLKEEIDFTTDDFEEEASFEQEIVIDDVDLDKKEKKAYVSALQIKDKKGNWERGTMIIDGSTEEGSDLAGMFKKLSYGDFVKVYGTIRNFAEVKEIEEEEVTVDKDNPFANFKSTSTVSKKFTKRGITNFISEIKIVDIDKDSFMKGKYTESDFELSVSVSSENPFEKKDDEKDDNDPWA